MAHLDDESFLESLPSGIDWENLPDLDSKPTHFKVNGLIWFRREFVEDKTEQKYKIGIEYGPFDSYEQAESFIENLDYESSVLEEDQTVPGHPLEHNSLRHKEYIGPPIKETLKISERSDDTLVELHFMKSIRDKILKGEKVFPVFLP